MMVTSYAIQRWAKYSKYSYSSTILPVLVLVLVLGRSVLVLVLVLEKVRTRPPLILSVMNVTNQHD